MFMRKTDLMLNNKKKTLGPSSKREKKHWLKDVKWAEGERGHLPPISWPPDSVKTLSLYLD